MGLFKKKNKEVKKSDVLIENKTVPIMVQNIVPKTIVKEEFYFCPRCKKDNMIFLRHNGFSDEYKCGLCGANLSVSRG